ncbi:MAG: hypothetical protein EZS28_040825, partial [Streblomastix strix]
YIIVLSFLFYLIIIVVIYFIVVIVLLVIVVVICIIVAIALLIIVATAALYIIVIIALLIIDIDIVAVSVIVVIALLFVTVAIVIHIIVIVVSIIIVITVIRRVEGSRPDCIPAYSNIFLIMSLLFVLQLAITVAESLLCPLHRFRQYLFNSLTALVCPPHLLLPSIPSNHQSQMHVQYKQGIPSQRYSNLWANLCIQQGIRQLSN